MRAEFIRCAPDLHKELAVRRTELLASISREVEREFLKGRREVEVRVTSVWGIGPEGRSVITWRFRNPLFFGRDPRGPELVEN